MVISFINGNSRGCQSTVILPLKPCSFDVIGNFKILDYCLLTKFSTFKQVTDSNSQLLNWLQMVTDDEMVYVCLFFNVL